MIKNFDEFVNEAQKVYYNENKHITTFDLKADEREVISKFDTAGLRRSAQAKRILPGTQVAFYYDDNEIWMDIPDYIGDGDRLVAKHYGFKVKGGNLMDFHTKQLNTANLVPIKGQGSAIGEDDAYDKKVMGFICSYFNGLPEPLFNN